VSGVRPLQPIGMGLLLILVHAGRFDFLPDPLGWLIILAGVSVLPESVERRSLLLGAAGLAGAVSIPLWWPDWAEALNDGDPSLWWAVNLPQLAFVLLLGLSLMVAARRAGDQGAARWWQLVATLATLAALLPVLVFGGGVDALEVPTYALGAATLLTVIVLCFTHAARPWVVAPERAADPDAR
jgi:uncharacterized membrane protein YhaH (DUF805 family)